MIQLESLKKVEKQKRYIALLKYCWNVLRNFFKKDCCK